MSVQNMRLNRADGDLLRRAALEMSQLRGKRVSMSEVAGELAGDWLARLHRAREAEQAVAQIKPHTDA